ncbi:uncharacterized protein EDB91DRAFT_84666 [Suillus paluster]|uniref:uncharacterized protein n=1 Tax=Suillus paluster TaxID=48578 RepID=UPI001B87E034|nr:uncharacterized protein EDB91DRAFT_84666 [Suillus paluster]KAG1725719.1 hypothetical protein EDB91DRAFT_84666 [Suillus paluster]
MISGKTPAFVSPSQHLAKKVLMRSFGFFTALCASVRAFMMSSLLRQKSICASLALRCPSPTSSRRQHALDTVHDPLVCFSFGYAVSAKVGKARETRAHKWVVTEEQDNDPDRA